jgi:hypothetical protein
MKDDLQQLLGSLHLRKIAEIFDDEAKRADKADLSYQEFVARLLRAQWQANQESALAWRIKRAGLPEQWTLESFPFKRQPGVNARQIRTFAVVRIDRDEVSGALAHMDAVWSRLSPNAPLQRQFADDLFETAYQNATVYFRVLAGLSGFAFIIAMLGLFGMSTHVTSRRRREIGIRKTLGATAPRVVFMLLRDFARPVVIANVIAWPLAFLAGRVYLELFVQRAPLSPGPFVMSLLITLAIAWGAVSMQAVRAAGLKPARVLRAD